MITTDPVTCGYAACAAATCFGGCIVGRRLEVVKGFGKQARKADQTQYDSPKSPDVGHEEERKEGLGVPLNEAKEIHADLINDLIKAQWPCLSQYFEKKMREEVEPTLNRALQQNVHKLLRVSFGKECNLGEKALALEKVRTGRYTQNTPGGDLSHMRIDSILDFAGCPHIDLKITVPGQVMQTSLRIESLHLKGRVVIEILQFVPEPPFFSGLRVMFPDVPDINVSLAAGKIVNAFISERLLEEHISAAITSIMRDAYVLPNSQIIPLRSNVDFSFLRHPLPQGVLRLSLQKASGIYFLPSKGFTQTIKGFFTRTEDDGDPYVEIIIGAEKKQTIHKTKTSSPCWDNEIFDIPVWDVEQDLCVVVRDNREAKTILGEGRAKLVEILKVEGVQKVYINYKDRRWGKVYIQVEWRSLATRDSSALDNGLLWRIGRPHVSNWLLSTHLYYASGLQSQADIDHEAKMIVASREKVVQGEVMISRASNGAHLYAPLTFADRRVCTWTDGPLTDIGEVHWTIVPSSDDDSYFIINKVKGEYLYAADDEHEQYFVCVGADMESNPRAKWRFLSLAGDGESKDLADGDCFFIAPANSSNNQFLCATDDGEDTGLYYVALNGTKDLRAKWTITWITGNLIAGQQYYVMEDIRDGKDFYKIFRGSVGKVIEADSNDFAKLDFSPHEVGIQSIPRKSFRKLQGFQRFVSPRVKARSASQQINDELWSKGVPFEVIQALGDEASRVLHALHRSKVQISSSAKEYEKRRNNLVDVIFDWPCIFLLDSLDSRLSLTIASNGQTIGSKEVSLSDVLHARDEHGFVHLPLDFGNGSDNSYTGQVKLRFGIRPLLEPERPQTIVARIRAYGRALFTRSVSMEKGQDAEGTDERAGKSGTFDRLVLTRAWSV